MERRLIREPRSCVNSYLSKVSLVPSIALSRVCMCAKDAFSKDAMAGHLPFSYNQKDVR